MARQRSLGAIAARNRPTQAELEASLASWTGLNECLRTADEAYCIRLLEAEKAGAKRTQHLLRIHARFNKLRGQRERGELMGG